jgi:hypothetical protein
LSLPRPAGLVLAAAAWTAGTAAMAPASACLPARDTGTAMLTSTPPRLVETGDLIMADGRPARLAGIRMLMREQVAFAAVLGNPASLGVSEIAAADRWGRITVTVLREGQDLALLLLQSGLAAVDPATAPGNCLNSYFKAERAARRAGQGSWPVHGPLDGGDSVAVAARSGQWAIVEGRIVSVGVTRRSAFLNFGARGQGSSIVLSLSQWRQIEAKGWTPARLRGQIVTARGVVDNTTPPRLVVETAAAIDVVE